MSRQPAPWQSAIEWGRGCRPLGHCPPHRRLGGTQSHQGRLLPPKPAIRRDPIEPGPAASPETGDSAVVMPSTGQIDTRNRRFKGFNISQLLGWPDFGRWRARAQCGSPQPFPTRDLLGQAGLGAPGAGANRRSPWAELNPYLHTSRTPDSASGQPSYLPRET